MNQATIISKTNMKKLAIALSALALLGAGCQWGNPEPPFVGTAYENSEYSFAFDYPETMDVRSREASVQPYDYLGMEVKFFASLRDLVKDNVPTNIAFLFAAPRLTADEFRQKLEASGAQDIRGPETIQSNGLTIYKFTNSTAAGRDLEGEEISALEKYHYLFDRGDQTIIASIFIGEHILFEPVLTTFREFE